MKKLTRDERCEIAALYKAGKTPPKIAKQIRRSISTTTRELSRNSTDGEYNFITANEVAAERRGRYNNQKITSDNWIYIRSLIRQKWSPAQIDQWLKGNPGVGFTTERLFISISKKIGKKMVNYISVSKGLAGLTGMEDSKNTEVR